MDFAATAIAVLIFLAIVIAGLAVERLAPAEAQPLAKDSVKKEDLCRLRGHVNYADMVDRSANR